MAQTRNNKLDIKPAVDITGIKVIIETGDFTLESNLEDLPNDLLDKLSFQIWSLQWDRDNLNNSEVGKGSL